MPTMSSFERLMVNRLDSFAENQRSLHDLCVSNFQRIDTRFDNMDARFMTLDEQIEAVQNQILEIFSLLMKKNEGKKLIGHRNNRLFLAVLFWF